MINYRVFLEWQPAVENEQRNIIKKLKNIKCFNSAES